MRGKLPPAALAALIAGGPVRPELLRGPALGEDAAVLDLGGDLVVVSADPITGAVGQLAGWLAVHINCNDVAAAGAEPVAFWSVVVGGDHAAAVRGMRQAAAELGVAIAGGHTEYGDRAMLVGVAMGRAPRAHLAAAGNLRPGQALVMTKTAGLEGTALRLPAPELYGRISVVADARAALAAGCRAMHDVTEGGLLGAAWEMAAASGCGVEVDADAVPVASQTAALCARDGLDPLRLLGSGALLCGADDGPALVRALAAAGVPAAVVGRVLPAGVASLLVRHGLRQPLAPPEADEYWSGARVAAAIAEEAPSPAARALLLQADPSPAAVDELLSRGRLFAARRGGCLVGAAVLREGELAAVAVVQAERRQGLGRALVERAAQAARAGGHDALTVGTAANGVGELLFYQKCGFRVAAIEPDWFAGRYPVPEMANGLPCLDRIRLRRALR
jgi:hydrogenase expression/formation protein HypE